MGAFHASHLSQVNGMTSLLLQEALRHHAITGATHWGTLGSDSPLIGKMLALALYRVVPLAI